MFRLTLQNRFIHEILKPRIEFLLEKPIIRWTGKEICSNVNYFMTTHWCFTISMKLTSAYKAMRICYNISFINFLHVSAIFVAIYREEECTTAHEHSSHKCSAYNVNCLSAGPSILVYIFIKTNKCNKIVTLFWCLARCPYLFRRTNAIIWELTQSSQATCRWVLQKNNGISSEVTPISNFALWM
jgi:hypothetical protein